MASSGVERVPRSRPGDDADPVEAGTGEAGAVEAGTVEAGTIEAGTVLGGGQSLRVRVDVGEDGAAWRSAVEAGAVAAAQAVEAHRRRDDHEPGDPSSGDAPGIGARFGIVGDSPPMRELFRLLSRVGPSEATVLVTGENGTGKELVARAIHGSSRRNEGAFVAVNCSAFQDELLESELFGHVRGAFTGAVADKPGLFAAADDGTLFLDEVGDMSPALQVKLLRVLQEGTFQPVGGVETRRVDVRIVAATNRDLGERVAGGEFREDLYYRLNVVHLRVPPLRERPGDIDRLVSTFVARLAERHSGPPKRLSAEVMARFQAHRWPGNVRELENEVERLWVLSGDEPLIGPEHLSREISRAPSQPAPPGTTGVGRGDGDGPVPCASHLEHRPDGTLPEAVEALERWMIARALERHGGNKTRAAAELGVSRRNLIRKVQAYDLDGGDRRSGDAGGRDRGGRP